MTGRHAPPRPRFGSGRGALLTLTDQVISSASNFLLGVLIARASGTEGLGTFGVAFLIWLAAVGVNRALITEPMTVTRPTQGREAQLPEGLLASVLLGLAASALLATADLVLGIAHIDIAALLALAPCLPSLLAHDYGRATAFRLQRPERALASDLGFALVQGVISVALLLSGIENTAAFMAAWGLGATVGAAISVVLNHIRPTLRGGLALVRGLWPRSRWFLAEFSTAFPSDQGYLLLLPVLLGTSQFGLYRAATGLVGPIVVIFIAGGNVGLPESVRRLRTAGMPGLTAYAPRLTGAVVAVAALYCGLVALLAEPLLRLTYGADFLGAVTVTRLVCGQYVLLALSFGYGQAAKATGRMRQLWVSRMASAAVSISMLLLLVHEFGLVGAGWASMVTGGAYSVGVFAAYWRIRADPPLSMAGPRAAQPIGS